MLKFRISPVTEEWERVEELILIMCYGEDEVLTFTDWTRIEFAE